jgi:uracil-DNA glycosylase family 4
VIYRQKIAKDKIKRFKHQTYWGKPLTGFGDVKAELLIVGLAPAAHGGNRTGRMFTGDSSGDWLAKVLYEHGFASKPTSQRVGDGFGLINAYITATARCAPPQNKLLKEELDNCSLYLKEELSILKNIKIIVCLGKIAFDSVCKLLDVKGTKFGHGISFQHGELAILSSYHPSRQNTQTGKLKWKQWSDIFAKAKEILDENK